MGIIEFIFVVGFALGHLYFILENTDFVVWYGRIFALNKFLKLEEFEIWKQENQLNSYPIFFRENFKGFFPHLFGCPFCFITFLSVAASVIGFFSIKIGLAAAAIGSIVYLSENLLFDKKNK